jgi:phosphoribosylaminoimidazole (AIR) synthetase
LFSSILFRTLSLHVGEALLTPTRIYTSSVMPVLWLGKIKGIAHITGGGILGNVSRVVPDGLCAELDALKWKMPPVFSWIASKVRCFI